MAHSRGPYELFLWDEPEQPRGAPRRLLLRVRQAVKQVNPEDVPVELEERPKNKSGFFHGGGIAHELVVLGSLFLRRRLTLKAVVRHNDRPDRFPFRHPQRWVAPDLAGEENVTHIEPGLDLLGKLRPELHLNFYMAARLYHEAIQKIEEDPRLAYVNLVSAMETVCRDHPIPSPTLADYDGKLAQLVAQVGDVDLRAAIEKQIMGRQRFIGRRFRLFVLDHLDDAFWDAASRPDPGSLRIDRESLPGLLDAVYKQRSKSLHEGQVLPPHAYTPPVHRAEIDGSYGGWADGRYWDREDYIPLVSFFEKLVNYVLRRYLERNQVGGAATASGT